MNARGRRVERRAAERRALKDQREGPSTLLIPQHIRDLTTQIRKKNA